ncbi:MAG: DUF1573 domain-containing protein [Tepidisphaeraceae bacterium]
MTDRFAQLRRKVCTIALLALVPGASVFLLARSRMRSEIQPAQSLDLDGLQIPEATIDIGTVWSGGQSVQREFTLTNRTGRQIRIESVVSDCGCTVPTIIHGKVENEQSTKIRVAFWPPAVAGDRGVDFRRTISVAVDTFKGKESFHLFLTGLVEPDESLRVFPVNAEIETPEVGAILHFKGSVSLLTSIPAALVVFTDRDQRILVKVPPAGRLDVMGTKDVKVTVAGNPSLNKNGDWRSAITFAPDALSDGLTIHLSSHAPRYVLATPPSLILTDDAAGSEATVRLTCKSGTMPILDAVKTDLPLALDFPETMPHGINFRTLHVRVEGRVSENIAGTIHIRASPQNAPRETMSIPVVLLQGGTGRL